MTPLPIVFAPGMMCDDRLFEKQASAMAGERPVFVADFSKDDTIAGIASRLLRNAPPQFYLAGLSMGGIVAFEAWRQAPERIAGLALLNTTAFADSPARRDTRLDQVKRVGDGQLRTVVMEELKPNYLGAKTRKDQAVLDEIYAMAERLGPDVFVAQSKALMARADSTQTLQTITCPTVVIAGEEDEVCPAELHEIIHRGISGSALHVLPNCGHLSTMEMPDEVTALLQNHVPEAEKGLKF